MSVKEKEIYRTTLTVTKQQRKRKEKLDSSKGKETYEQLLERGLISREKE